MSKQDQLSMDEEALFRDIHHHILRQAKAGERIDTETELATRFNVTRYKVRKALSVLSQMGVVDRAPKRGMTVNACLLYTSPSPRD